jgi:glycine cleavage system regulatory protein
VSIEADDRQGLLRDISEVFAKELKPIKRHRRRPRPSAR